MNQLMTLREVAKALEVTEQRVYQLDAELEPVHVPRGKKMTTRYYRPEKVAEARSKRAARSPDAEPPPRSKTALRRAARHVAAQMLGGYACAAPFFPDVQPNETEIVRVLLRDIARDLRGGVS